MTPRPAQGIHPYRACVTISGIAAGVEHVQEPHRNAKERYLWTLN